MVPLGVALASLRQWSLTPGLHPDGEPAALQATGVGSPAALTAPPTRPGGYAAEGLLGPACCVVASCGRSPTFICSQMASPLSGVVMCLSLRPHVSETSFSRWGSGRLGWAGLHLLVCLRFPVPWRVFCACRAPAHPGSSALGDSLFFLFSHSLRNSACAVSVPFRWIA